MRGSQWLASGQREGHGRRPSGSGYNSERLGAHRGRWTHLLGLFFLLLAGLPPGQAAPPDFGVQPNLIIPRVSRPPALEDFLTMKPNGKAEGQLAKVEGFLQREPSDGAPATQRTEAYIGYDDKNLYVVFVCFDQEPEKIRARMVPRENIFGDDLVEVMLDTFHDQRRAFGFVANPHGIQWDGLWTEGQGWDGSFDTLWHSKGQRTPDGFVVWMAIPFKSLRFTATPEQTWGIVFLREVPRNNEESFWPRVSSRVEGRLNQAATLQGLENISPGRNVQLIPFGVFRSFRALDTRDPLAP
ncbi:MAG: carbohydrate binding family 9 domain-containing protein, partial [Terriglobia bacterium]